jgi:hypothetical protein
MFKAWPKIPRIENKKEFYTEKIDGTNACVGITEEGVMFCQSRSRIITPDDDNFGFAKWAYANKDELLKLGPGYHYGEWWGLGIQRGYGLTEKRFSLFNTKRWGPHNPNTPLCCHVVPTINANTVEEAKNKLIECGSLASPRFMAVEGVVIYEAQSDSYWKAIINK